MVRDPATGKMDRHPGVVMSAPEYGGILTDANGGFRGTPANADTHFLHV